LRSGCKPNQNVYVSGALGGCRAGLELQLNPQLHHWRSESWAAQLIARQQVPEPRVALGRFLAENHPDVAIIDISDGLHNELHLLSESSRVGFEIDLERTPLFPGGEQFCASRGVDGHKYALSSGEEYELLFCTAADEAELHAGLANASISTRVTKIGHVTAGQEILFIDNHWNRISIEPETFKHFTQA
jgi:thiamine-monophosphate kinase